MSNTLVLIYPVHLYDNIKPILPKSSHSNYTYLLVEDPLYFSDKARIVKFNVLKLLLHRVSMKIYFDKLVKEKLNVRYLEYLKVVSDLPNIIKKYDKIVYYDPVDHLLEKRLNLLLRGKKQIKLNPQGFICTNSDFEEFFQFQKGKKRKFFQTDFYRWQRNRLNVLIEKDNSYSGGKLTFDKENRGSYPKDLIEYPSYHKTESTPYIKEAVDYINQTFSYYGKIEDNWNHIAFDTQTAKEKLEDFLSNRLETFGEYQDVIDVENPWLSHSLLSCCLNIGILTPSYVVNRAIEFYNKKKNLIEINNIEGFIRQIIGWREYYRMVYLYLYDDMISTNYLGNTNKLNKCWYTGKTGIFPIDHSIKTAFHYGYLHHIIRLMVVGQFMLLCQIDPNEIYRWFMEFSIDSYDWVMVPNVYGMVGYNDAGKTTTKVYISSDNYIKKMSNYSQFDKKWEKTWYALYYNFLYKHKDVMKSNPRMGRMLWHMDNMDSEKLKELVKTAEDFLAKLK